KATGTGAPKQSFSWTLFRDGHSKLLENLADAAAAQNLIGPGGELRVSLVHFTIEVQHTPPGSDRIFIYRVKGCRLIGDNMDHKEGTDLDVVECPLHVKRIVDVIKGREVVLL